MQKLYQKFTLLIFLILAGFTVKAQYVTIPDSSFVVFLKQTYPNCMNGNQMDTTCSGIVNETYLYCPIKGIADLTGMQYFDKMKILDCQGNQLSSLPTLPNTLTDLNCGSNKISSLQNLPAALISLFCSNNKLTTLPTLPNSIRSIYCDSNPLTSLPDLPTSLRDLSCRKTNISSLPTLPPLLLALDCTSDTLHSLPALPDSMVSLSCTDNRLDSLPTLPTTLKSLWCNGNGLHNLPPLSHTSLEELVCFANRLTELPGLPKTLIKLYCYSNQLASLPELPDTLDELNCSSNRLTSLPPLPASLSMLLVSSNINLACIPPLKKFTGNQYTFSVQFTKIKCFPNVIQHTGYFAPIDTMPVCDLFYNPNGCELGWNIQGTVFNDSSKDCLYQKSETKVPQVKMNVYKDGNLVESGYFVGSYSFKPGFGTYQVGPDTSGLPFDFCRTDTIITVSLQDSLKYNIDFGLQCKPGFDVGVRSISGRFVPSRTLPINIGAGDLSNFYKAHCSSGVGGTVTISISGPAKYAGPEVGALSPTSHTDSSVTWNFADFDTTDFNSSFNILAKTDTTAVADEEVCIRVEVSPMQADNDPTDNNLEQCFKVRASYDPNIKDVYPAGNTDVTTKWLTYTIHFQNTGTDTAYNIYITDTLSSYIDVASFQLLSSSHKNTTQIYENGLVKFNFPNILLPDSHINEMRSHGYIQYKVKLKKNLPVGTVVPNTAYIYFDFNAPVVTNTTINTITQEVATGLVKPDYEWQLNVFPNPANEKLYIIATGFLPQHTSLYDINGQKVTTGKFSTQIDISTLPAGIYFIEVNSSNEVARKRFVKL